jgi:histidinol-phosphate aminotransferase
MTSSRRGFLNAGVGVAAGVAVRCAFGEPLAADSLRPAPAAQSDGLIHLDSNENAYGPSAKVAEAIRSAIGMVNRYPLRKYDEVTEQIARFHQVKPEQVLFGCGSTEMLRVTACAFLGRGRQLIQAVPTFEAIEDYAKSVGAEVVSVPLDPSFAHDAGRMLERVGPATGLVYICNPNNPTATITPRKDLEEFIGRLPANIPVLIDEAYHDYATHSGMYASFIDRPLRDERVVVTRTFSKVYGLAGLRLGYAVASPGILRKMRALLTRESLNAIMAEVAGVALEDTQGVRDFVKLNSDDRQEFFNSAMLRMLMPVDSHTNFVMTNIQHPAVEVIEHFRKHNILIGRHFPPLDNYIRVSLGTPDEMRAFWRIWDLLPWAKKFIHH